MKQLGHDLLNNMMQDPKYVKDHRKIQKQARLVDRHYDELAGQALPIDSNLSQAGGILRSWTVATKMRISNAYSIIRCSNNETSFRNEWYSFY